MKKNILITLTIFGIAFVIFNYSCSKESNAGPPKKEFIIIPSYDKELMGLHSSGRSNELCCDCSNKSCSTKKCCISPQSCACTCTSSFWEASCTCSSCGQHLSYELWLTDAQYSFWTDLNTILVNDGSGYAANAQTQLSNALSAVASDDFPAFALSKSRMRTYCTYLSGTTKSAINSLLTANDFTDTL